MKETTQSILDKYFLGVSKIFNELVKLRKPVVGHNFMKDLIMLYKQFWGPLPESYATFKRNLHNLFPVVYDTKHLMYELRTWLPKYMDDDFASLAEMYW